MRLKLSFKIVIIFLLFSCESKVYELKKDKLTKEIYEAQSSKSFDHIEYIRKKTRPKQAIDKFYSQKYFVDYVIENLLESPSHKKYITSRSLLKKLENRACWDNSFASIEDTLLSGEVCKIKIETQLFNPVEHKLKYEEQTNYLIEVDGKYPYGAVYFKHPKKELKSLSISIDGKELGTKIESYVNIYEPALCDFGGYRRIVEAFEDGENLYIYFFGGNAAGSYFAKLIFDRSGFVTSIIADYDELSEYGSFGNYFIGF